MLFVGTSVCLLTTFTLVGLLIFIFFSDWNTSFNVECVSCSVSSLIVFICTSGLVTTVYCFNSVKFIRDLSVVSWSVSIWTSIILSSFTSTEVATIQMTIAIFLINANYLLDLTGRTWRFLFQCIFSLLITMCLSVILLHWYIKSSWTRFSLSLIFILFN